MRASGRADRRRRIECAGRRQGTDCDAPSFFAEVLEDQLTDVLSNFQVPEDRREELVKLWQERSSDRQTAAQERDRLTAKLERIRTLYIEGDIDEESYRRQRAEIAAALTAIPSDELPSTEAVGRRLATLLADLALAWTVATPVERNKIARELFADVIIDNRTAVAVKPRPELLPFFETMACQPGDEITPGRTRRGSYAHGRYGEGYAQGG